MFLYDLVTIRLFLSAILSCYQFAMCRNQQLVFYVKQTIGYETKTRATEAAQSCCLYSLNKFKFSQPWLPTENPKRQAF